MAAALLFVAAILATPVLFITIGAQLLGAVVVTILIAWAVALSLAIFTYPLQTFMEPELQR